MPEDATEDDDDDSDDDSDEETRYDEINQQLKFN